MNENVINNNQAAKIDVRASPPRFSIKQAIAEDEGDEGVVAGARATAACWLSLMVLRRNLGASCVPRARCVCVAAHHFTLDNVRHIRNYVNS